MTDGATVLENEGIFNLFDLTRALSLSNALPPSLPDRLLGPGIRWTNLNPQKIVNRIREIESYEGYEHGFSLSYFADFMKRVSRGERCLHVLFIDNVFFRFF